MNVASFPILCLYVFTELKDELDAKVIETSDANRRNVELEVDVQRLSNELNLAISE